MAEEEVVERREGAGDGGAARAVAVWHPGGGVALCVDDEGEGGVTRRLLGEGAIAAVEQLDHPDLGVAPVLTEDDGRRRPHLGRCGEIWEIRGDMDDGRRRPHLEAEAARHHGHAL